jgi:MoaA/NifB/PqqE/SkfB family radical SAM enzyme
VLHLNRTAAEYAYHYVHQTPVEEIANQIASRYHVSKQKALRDYEDFRERIWTLIDVPDLDPITYLDFEREVPYSTEISAPYRLDCALTYRLPPGSDPEAAPTRRVERELDTDEWRSVLDKSWDIGIPHIIFTGGEPTLRQDLPDLIAHAEANGQVTGLLTDGLLLTDSDYLNILLQTGLDHLMVVMDVEGERTWTALEAILPQDLYTVVHLTITPENKTEINGYLERLSNMGVNAVSLSASDHALEEDLQQARKRCAELDIPLVWDLPVPYSERNPITLETPDDLPEGSGHAWLYIEPDGDVLPAQGINQVLGNFLKDSWDDIWKVAKQF